MAATLLRRRAFVPPAFVNRSAPAARAFQLSSRQFARKDTQDKDSINTESNEYSKSGGDKAAAATEDAAFNPNETRPEQEHDKAGKEAGGQGMDNPLDVSPANQDVSQPKDGQQGGPEGSAGETGGKSGRSRSSGGGSPNKTGRG